ncbi:MAG TPA: M56 family metallopeptidase [Pseudonocardia sp.]
MFTLAAVPLLIGVVLGCSGPRLVSSMKPSLAVPVFSVVAFAVSLSTGLVLSVLAVLVCVQLEPFPSWGQWSAATLRTSSAVPLPVGFVALGLVTMCGVAALVRLARSARTLLTARRAARQFGPATDNLVMLPTEEPIAYTVAATEGPIVLSTAMLSALTPDEHRALMAHERSHLHHRHFLYIHAVRLAAAANPMLRPTAEAVARAVERWADEDAAAEVGDRVLVARALARAGLAQAKRQPDRPALAAADTQVAERVRALLHPPPRARPSVLIVLAVTTVLGALAAIAVTLRLHDLVEIAEQVYGPS